MLNLPDIYYKAIDLNDIITSELIDLNISKSLSYFERMLSGIAVYLLQSKSSNGCGMVCTGASSMQVEVLRAQSQNVL
jgi:hypothetical protein